MSVRHIVFAVAPDLVLLDACGPLEAFWRAELTMAAAQGASDGGGRVPIPANPATHADASVPASTHSPARPIAYRTTVASIDGGVLQTFPGLPVVTERLDSLDAEPIDTLIVPGVPVDQHCTLQPELVAWIRRNAPRARRVCSVCTGAF